MKTKSSILLIILLFVLTGLSAQTYYYNVSKFFHEDGYSYRCDVNTEAGSVSLYNANNVKTNERYAFKDGSPLTSSVRFGRVKLIESDTWTKKKCNTIINNAFSSVEKQRVKGRRLSVCMTIDTNTGNVIEVDFWFRTDVGYSTIPVSVYRNIELGLKENIWFTLTNTGKKLNFIKRSWMHEVK